MIRSIGLGRYVHGLTIITILGFALAAQSRAQQVLYGAIAGTITDQSGAAVPGAAVGITNDTTGLSRKASTDADGGYTIISLPPGTYTLNVSAAGFQAVKMTGIRVTAGSTVSTEHATRAGRGEAAGHGLRLGSGTSDANYGRTHHDYRLLC